MTNEVKVELKTLIAHAQERYEDAIVCDGARKFITHVGNVPHEAFGNLPWSAQWRRDWMTAVGARFTEAGTLRNVLADTSGALYQVAADYSDCDVTSAVELDVQVQDLAAFVDGSAAPHTYRPGAGNTYHRLPETPLDRGFARDSEVWRRLTSSSGVVKNRMVPPGTPQDTQAIQYYGDSPGTKALHEFNDKFGKDLVIIENIVQTIRPGIGQPMRNEIRRALSAKPKILWERADLFHSLANSYKEMRDEYSGETTNLQAHWYSPGAASAYFAHANVILTYLDSVKAEATWIAEEGKKGANLVDRLQLTYANIGHEHIKTLLDHYQVFVDETHDCIKSKGPGEALANVFAGFATAIINQEKTKATEAQNMLQLTQTVQDHKPDLGTKAHAPVPFPQVQGGDGWKNGDDWKPGENPRPPLPK